MILLNEIWGLFRGVCPQSYPLWADLSRKAFCNRAPLRSWNWPQTHNSPSSATRVLRLHHPSLMTLNQRFLSQLDYEHLVICYPENIMSKMSLLCLFSFEAESLVNQADLPTFYKLSMYLNSWSSCLTLPCVGIIGMHCSTCTRHHPHYRKVC